MWWVDSVELFDNSETMQAAGGIPRFTLLPGRGEEAGEGGGVPEVIWDSVCDYYILYCEEEEEEFT